MTQKYLPYNILIRPETDFYAEAVGAEVSSRCQILGSCVTQSPRSRKLYAAETLGKPSLLERLRFAERYLSIQRLHLSLACFHQGSTPRKTLFDLTENTASKALTNALCEKAYTQIRKAP